MNFSNLKLNKIDQLPKTAGVYAFFARRSLDEDGKKDKEILYIGKATNIRERVKNHFPSRNEGKRRSQKQVSSPVSPSARRTNVLRTPSDNEEKRRMNLLRTQRPTYRDGLFINQVKKVGFIETNSEIEALILEANLIKKYRPKYNVVWKDDKNYFYIEITKDDFPRVLIAHQIRENATYMGPFVEGKSLKRTLTFLRKVFPYYTSKSHPKRSCLWCDLRLCPGPNPDKKGYRKNIKNLISVLRGESGKVLKKLKEEMEKSSVSQNYEKAAKTRDQIGMLERVIFNSRVFELGGLLENKLPPQWRFKRIEAYDISNIQGKEAVGSMVVFSRGKPDKNQYRKFKIKMEGKPNDIAMMKEVLSRRFAHPEWPYPDLILIDGGIAQLNIAKRTKNRKQKTKNIPVMALAKKENKLYIENKKEPLLLKTMPREIFNLILQLRDEAHRFAIAYHHKLRIKTLL